MLAFAWLLQGLRKEGVRIGHFSWDGILSNTVDFNIGFQVKEKHNRISVDVANLIVYCTLYSESQQNNRIFKMGENIS